MAGWKRFLLMFLMVAVPVPLFAASGLAVPLPAVVYRAAAGLAEQTQAVAVRLPGVGDIVSERSRTARTGTIRLSAEELAAGGAAPRLEVRAPARPPGQKRVERQRRGRASKNAGVTPAPRSRTTRARAAREPGKGALPAAETLPSAARRDEAPAPPAAPPDRGRAAGEQKPEPAAGEAPASAPTPSPAHPVETKSAPKDDHKPAAPAPPTSPPPALPPPPPPSPLPVTPPIDPASTPVALTPERQLESVADDLRKLIEAKPGTRRADRLQQVLDKVESALGRLAKKPPDNEGAIGDIRNAVQKLDAALLEGVISPLERTEFVTRLEAASTLLKARL
jgi:hypothetical protein